MVGKAMPARGIGVQGRGGLKGEEKEEEEEDEGEERVRDLSPPRGR